MIVLKSKKIMYLPANFDFRSPGIEIIFCFLYFDIFNGGLLILFDKYFKQTELSIKCYSDYYFSTNK